MEMYLGILSPKRGFISVELKSGQRTIFAWLWDKYPGDDWMMKSALDWKNRMKVEGSIRR